MEFNHKPIMVSECINGLNINPEGIYVDCTVGGGGHSFEISKNLGENGHLIGIDRDINAIEASSSRLSAFSEKVLLVKGNFFEIENILQSLNINGVDGILADLGVSSHQLDSAIRGFSYMQDGALDMRMDTSKKFSAYDVVNGYTADKLFKIISQYGEERYAKRIASFIEEERKIKPIQTTFELVSVIKKAIPAKARQDGPHPAKRTFQAIRIEVNEELSGLESALKNMVKMLKPGGRVCVITFHSLEDRIAKNTFKEMVNPCTCPIDFPMCVCKKEPVVKLISRKPIIPDDSEINENPRARSAKLRIAEKL